MSWSTLSADTASPSVRAAATRAQANAAANAVTGQDVAIPHVDGLPVHAAEPRTVNRAVTAILAGGAAAATSPPPGPGAPVPPNDILSDANGTPLAPPGLAHPDTAALRLALRADELLVSATGQPVYDGGRDTAHLRTLDERSVGSDFFRFFSTPPRYDEATQLGPQQNAQGGAPNGIANPTAYVGRQNERCGKLTSSILDSDNPHTARKRTWAGTPDPEEERRSSRRPRPAGTTPLLRSGARLSNEHYADSNPWANERVAGVERDRGSERESHFIPVASSTPILPSVLQPDQSRTQSYQPILADVPNATRPRLSERTALPLPPRSTDAAASRRYPEEHAALWEEHGAGMDVDEAAEQPHAQEHAVPPASKGKGKARATTAELEQPCGDNIATTDEPQEEWDGWDSSQLLAARQESLQQVLRDRGRRGGGHNHPDGQTAGAGPSGARYEPSRSRNGMTLYGLSTVREERASHGHEEHESGRRSRWTHQHDSDDFRMRENADRSGHPTYYGERARSEYVPMPDTRAGDYLANRGRGPVLQRSPASRLRGLQGTQSPPLQPLGLDSPFVPRKLANLCDEEPAMERRRHEDRWSEPDHEQDGRAGWEQRPDEEWDEEHRQQREDGEVLPTALWATALRDDAAPTPVPLEGYPTIHRDDPETALRGMAIEWMREVWSDPANTVVLVHVYNYRYTEDDALNRRVAEALRRAFETLTGESDFDVVPPETEDGERRRARDLPSAWAIRGLSPEGTAAAVERGTWSSQAISFVAAPRRTAMQTWLFALDGFLVGNEQKIRDAVLRILCEDDMWTWLREMVSANPSFAGMSATHAVNEVVRTLRVDIVQLGNGGYVANIHMRSPTRSLREWRAWVAELRSRRYHTFAIGTGRVRYIARCPGCTSVTHPSHLCPFPSIRGWNGPQSGAGVFGNQGQSSAPRNATARRGGWNGRTAGRYGSGDGGDGRTPGGSSTRQDTPRSRREDRNDRGDRSNRYDRNDQNGRNNRGPPPKRARGRGNGRN